MTFSSSGAPMSIKEHAVGVSVGPGGSVSISSGGYSAFTSGSHDFQGPGEFAQQREFLTQRNMMGQPAEHHSQVQNQNSSHSHGPKVPTHDFLSLYGDNSSQYSEHHDSSRGLASSLTTKDFLQPLERGNHAGFRDGQPLRGEKHSRQQDVVSHGSSAPTTSVVDRLLNSGMGVYNGSHNIPNFTRIGKGGLDLPPTIVRMVNEGNAELRSRCGFNPPSSAMLAREDHEARKDVVKDQDSTIRGDNLSYWSNVRPKFGMISSDLSFHASNPTTSHGVMDNVQQPPMPNLPKQWPQSIQGVIDGSKRPMRVLSEEDEEDDEEDYGDRSRDIRKETSTKADSTQKPEIKNPETRGGTPRSKHSATEQRRRSKINDRFQMLRELVPHSDQKRDKASFLLEVIEYIQVLQEKVRKFETAEQERHQDRLKNMVWDLCKRTGSAAGDTRVEAAGRDAFAFAKDYAPPAVSVMPIDVKQPVETIETGRQKTLPSANENGNSEPLPHPAPHPHKIPHHSGGSSHEDKECGAGMMKSPLTVQQLQAHASYSTILVSPPVHQVSVSSDPKTNMSNEVQVPNFSTTVSSISSFDLRSKPTEADSPPQFKIQTSTQVAQQCEVDSSDLKESDSRHRNASPVEDTGNGLASSSDSDPLKHRGMQDSRQGTSPRATSCQATDDSQGGWQGQQLGSLNDNSQQKDESRVAATSSHEEDPLTIQGGVINVSSVYSQGLLDTLTRALQSSGLDLSQANISVQIDLGKSILSASLPSAAPKVAGQQFSEPSGSKLDQAEDSARQRGSLDTDADHPPLKRPKLEL